jgi:hypothetical protein
MEVQINENNVYAINISYGNRDAINQAYIRNNNTFKGIELNVIINLFIPTIDEIYELLTSDNGIKYFRSKAFKDDCKSIHSTIELLVTNDN